MSYVSVYIVVFLLFWGIQAKAQVEKISLEDCIRAVEQHYPLLRQATLEGTIGSLQEQQLGTGWLPQVNIAGQGTYQSDVTSIPISIPGMPAIEPLSQDQYRITADISQLLYDGGMINTQTAISEISSAIKSTDVAVQKRGIMEQAMVQFVQIELVNNNILLLRRTMEDIQARLEILKSAYSAGTAKKSQLQILEVELIKLGQKEVELLAQGQNARKNLGFLTGLQISDNTTIILQDDNIYQTPFSLENKPETTLFSLREQFSEQQQKLAGAKLLPKVSAFGQAGYGRPGLNMLNNDFDFFYIVGIKASWNIAPLYAHSAEVEQASVQKQIIAAQRESFGIAQQMQYSTLQKEAEMLQQKLAKDDEIIAARTEIATTAAAELEQGVITATEYLLEKNALLQAQQNKALNYVHYIMSQYKLYILLNY